MTVAMHRTRPSAPARWLVDHGYLPDLAGQDFEGTVHPTIDYGCGLGADCDTFGWFGYDPVHRPWGKHHVEEFHFSNAYCGYVLNTVDEAAQMKILQVLGNLADVSYIAVRRDLPKEGRPGRDCFQRYVELPLGKLKETTNYCIYISHGGT